MKKLTLLLLVSISFLFAKINEYKSDVYFANGINTDSVDAYLDTFSIGQQFDASFPESYIYVANWKVSVNHTQGIGIDLYESMLQKIDEDWKIKYGLEAIGLLDYTYSGIAKMVVKKVAKKEIEKFAAKQAAKIAKVIFTKLAKYKIGGMTQIAVEYMFKKIFDDLITDLATAVVSIPEEDIKRREQSDIKKQFKSYTESIKQGHGVVVIAHSQGNLFTNIVYNMFENHLIPWKDDTKWMKNYFSAFAVASPASNILGNSEPHITFDNDIITFVPNNLPWNIKNPTRYYFKNAVGEVYEDKFSIDAHLFLTSYMKEKVTRDLILGFIRNRVDEQAYNKLVRPSQWEIEQELNKNSCDYRVTIKHRYDPSIEIGEAVFPFNLTKKIYYVDNEYAMGSYGGNKIFNDWQGKKSNECSMLDNAEHEVITNGEPSDGGDNSNGGNTDDNNTGGDSDNGGDTDNGGGADNGNGSDNGDNNATDPTQDPNKVCVSNYFKYGNGEIIEDLKKGDKDEQSYSDGTKHQVKELQEFLEAFGYDVGTSGADGWFGSDTKSALINFQSNNGLDADGIVGPNTRKAMNSQNCYDKPPQ